MQEYRNPAACYQSAKREVFYISQATIATQFMLNKNCRREIRKIIKYHVKQFTFKDESDTLDVIKSTNGEFKENEGTREINIGTIDHINVCFDC
jgi:hypothetical protein